MNIAEELNNDYLDKNPKTKRKYFFKFNFFEISNQIKKMTHLIDYIF